MEQDNCNIVSPTTKNRMNTQAKPKKPGHVLHQISLRGESWARSVQHASQRHSYIRFRLGGRAGQDRSNMPPSNTWSSDKRMVVDSSPLRRGEEMRLKPHYLSPERGRIPRGVVSAEVKQEQKWRTFPLSGEGRR